MNTYTHKQLPAPRLFLFGGMLCVLFAMALPMLHASLTGSGEVLTGSGDVLLYDEEKESDESNDSDEETSEDSSASSESLESLDSSESSSGSSLSSASGTTLLREHSSSLAPQSSSDAGAKSSSGSSLSATSLDSLTSSESSDSSASSSVSSYSPESDVSAPLVATLLTTGMPSAPINIFPTFSIPLQRDIQSAEDLRKRLDISAEHLSGGTLSLTPTIIKTDDAYILTLTPKTVFMPGAYTIRLSLDGGRGLSYAVSAALGLEESVLLFEGSVNVGTILWNTDKTQYATGQTARIGLSLMSDAPCMTWMLRANDAEGIIATYTNSGTYMRGNCGDDAFAPTFETSGTYDVTLTDGIASDTRSIAVADTDELLQIRRIAPTEISPEKESTMLLKIMPTRTFVGTISEAVPSDLSPGTDDIGADIDRRGDETLIFWEKRWEAGKVYELSYTIRAEDEAVYLLGPVSARGEVEDEVEDEEVEEIEAIEAIEEIEDLKEIEPTTLVELRGPGAINAIEDSSASSESSESLDSSESSSASLLIPQNLENNAGLDSQSSSSVGLAPQSSESDVGSGALSFIDRISSFLSASLFGQIISDDASANEVRFNEERLWQMRSVTRAVQADAPLAIESSSLELTPLKDLYEAKESPSFRLLEVDIDSADVASDGHLDSTVAFTEIAKATVSRDDIAAHITSVLVEEHSADIVQTMLNDSASATDLREEFAIDASMRRTDVLEDSIADALAEESISADIAALVQDDAGIASVVDTLITDDVIHAVVHDALTDGNTAADVIADALNVNDDASAIGTTIASAVQEAPLSAAIIAGGAEEEATNKEESDVLRVTLTDADGRSFSPRYHFEKGSVILVLEPERSFTPGLYILTVTVTNPLTGATQTFEQDFAWGVLAMNTDKDVYAPGDRARIDMGVLDDTGNIVCLLPTASGANLEPIGRLSLSVESPSGDIIQLSTDDSSIIQGETCGKTEAGLIDPDYHTTLTFAEEGMYHLTLIATTPNGERQITADITVTPDAPITISRQAATRLWPFGPSPMDITVSLREDFSGTITDVVPEGFIITASSPEATITTEGSQTLLSWDVSGDAGDSIHLSYEYDAPNISPQFYLIGPLILNSPAFASGLRPAGNSQLSIFNSSTLERRSWQIANDAVKTWDGGGTDETCGGVGTANNWSCAANWSGDTAPTVSDTVTFDATSTKNVTINSTISVAGVNIYDTYTGTITQAAAMTIGSSGWTQTGSTFTGGSQAITLNGSFYLQGSAAFTSTSGTFTVGTDSSSTTFLIGTATFTHNSGTVKFRSNNGIMNANAGSTIFNNVEMATSSGNFALTGTLDVNGNFTMTTAGNNNGGTIAVAGNITVLDTGTAGTTVIVADGTEDQILSAGGGTAMMCSFTINKASGTLTMQDTITTCRDATWTHTAGTVDAGTSTVRFSSDNGLVTVNAPGMRFSNVELSLNGGSLSLSGDMFVSNNFIINSAGSISSSTIYVGGNLVSKDTGVSGTTKMLVAGTGAQIISTITSGDYPDGRVTIAKPSGTISLSGALTLNATGQDLIMTGGTLDMSGSSLKVNDQLTLSGGTLIQRIGNLTGGTISLASGAKWLNDSTGDVYVGAGGVYNKGGYIRLNTSGGACSSTDDILIRSTTTSTRRNWTGSGSNHGAVLMYDVDVKDMTGSSLLTVYSGTSTNNGPNWTFNSSCPTEKHWIGSVGGGTTWATAANWLEGSAPGASDTAVFDGATSTGATIDSTISIGGVKILSAYTGTITQSAAMTIGSSGWTQSGATFIGSSAGSTIAINGSFRIENGQFNLAQAALTQTINHGSNIVWSATSGSILAGSNSSVNIVLGEVGGSATMTMSGSQNLNNLTFTNTYPLTLAITLATGTNITSSGTLTLAGTQLLAINGGTLTAQGDVNIDSTNSFHGTTTIQFTGSRNQLFEGHASNTAGQMPNITINKNGGTLTLSGTLRTAKNWTYTAGTVVPGTSTVVFGRTTSDSGTFTPIISGSQRFYNLRFHNNNCCNDLSPTISAGTNITVSNDLVIGKVAINTGNLEAKGSVTIESTALGGTASLKLSGTGTQILEREGGTPPGGLWTIAKTAGTVTLSGALTLNTSGQDLIMTGGTLDLNGHSITVNDRFDIGTGTTLRLEGGETLTGGPDRIQKGAIVWYDKAGETGQIKNLPYQHLIVGSTGSAVFNIAHASKLNLSGSLTISGGTLRTSNAQNINLSGSWLRQGNGSFSAGTGTVTLFGINNATLSGSTTFYNLTKNSTSGTHSISAGEMTVGNLFTLTDGAFTVGSNTALATTGDTTTMSIAASKTFTNNGTVKLGGTSPVTLNGTWTNAPTSTVILTGNSSDGTVTVPSLNYANLRINNTGSTFDLGSTLSASGNILLAAGTLDSTASNYGIRVGGSWTKGGGSFTKRASNVTFTGSGSISTSEPFHNVTMSGTSVYTLGSALSISGSLVIRAGTLYTNAALTTPSLSVQGGTLSGSTTSFDINGNLTLTGGTLIAPTGTFTLSGSFLKSGSSTFTPGASTLTLDGGNQTLTGSTTFYNLTKYTTGATLTFAATTTQTITNTLTLKGGTTTKMNLRSSVTGLQWNIDPQGTRTLSNVDVKDSNNLNASIINCSQNCANSGNNDAWIFPITGTVYSDEGITSLGAGKTVSVSINGAAIAGTDETDSDGSFAITDLTIVDGDVVSVYIDGETENAAVITVSDGQSFAGFDLYQNHLILRNETGSSITSAHLNTADDLADADLTDFYTILGNDVIIATGNELFVRAGSTFKPTGLLTVDDIDVRGGLSMNGKTLNISGSFNAAADATVTQTGTTIMDSPLTEVLSISGSTLSTLNFTGGGTYTLSGALRVDTALRIQAGTLDLAGHALNTTSATFRNDTVLRLRGSETLTGFTNDTASGTVIFNGSSSYTGLARLTSFKNLSFSGAGTWTLNSAISTNGLLTLSGGTLDVSASSFGISTRSWKDASSASFVERRGTVSFTGTGSVSTNETFSGVLLRARGTTVTLNTALPITGNLTLSGGTLKVPDTQTYAITLSGTLLTKLSGGLSPGSGSVILDSGTHQTLSGSTTFYNLSKSVTATSTLTFAPTTTQTVKGTLTLAGAASNLLSLRSSLTGTLWRVDPRGARTLSFIDIKDSNNINATTVLCSLDCINSGNNTNWAFPITVTAYTDSGTTLVTDGTTIAIAVNGGTATTAVTTSGIASFTTVAASAGDILTIWFDGSATDGVTATITNGTSLAFDLYKDYLIVQHEQGSNVTNANLDTAHDAGSSDADIDAIYTMSGSELVMRPGKTLRIKAGSVYAPGSETTVDNIEIQGTFTMGSNAITVEGSWDAEGGTFTGSNTVTFIADSEETITSDGNSFNNVVFAVEGDNAEWITTDQMTINGTQTVRNANGSNDTTDPVISSVSGSLISDTRALITWETNESANSYVAYGTVSGSLTSNVSSSNLNLNHALTLSSLTASTTYYYTVSSTDLGGNIATSIQYSFTTTAESTDGAASSAGGGAASSAAETRSGGGGGGRRADATPPSFSNIKTVVNGTTVTITWETDEVANSLVSLGIDEVDEELRGDPSSLEPGGEKHTVILKDLKGSTTYKYSAVSIDLAGNVGTSDEGTFKTLADDSLLSSGSLLHGAATQEEAQALIKDLSERYAQLMKQLAGQVSINALKDALMVQSASIVELAMLVPGPVLSGQPTVVPTPTTATITWGTNEASNSLVSYASAELYTDGTYAATGGNPDEQTNDHSITLTGLTPGTLYHFSVKSQTSFGTETVSNDFTFRTPQQGIEIQSYAFEILSSNTAVFRWKTNVDTTTVVTYTPYINDQLRTESAVRKEVTILSSSHQLTIDDFEPGVFYAIELSGRDSAGNIVSKVINRFATNPENLAPIIMQVQTDAAIVPGKDSKIQAVISWNTNENATGRVFYQKGINTDPLADLTEATPLDDSYAKKHVILLPSLEPGTIYSFQMESADASGKVTKSRTFSILTPRQDEGIIQVIMKQMEDAFGWIGNLRN